MRWKRERSPMAWVVAGAVLVTGLFAAAVGGRDAAREETPAWLSPPGPDAAPRPARDVPEPDSTPATWPARAPREHAALEEALGALDDLSPGARRAFDIASAAPMKPPVEGDWILEHPEPRQPVSEFLKTRPAPPDAAHRTLYLLPLGELPEDSAPPIELLKEFTGAYFGLPVVALPGIALGEVSITSRDRGGYRQLLSGDILALAAARRPADAYGLIVVTVEDLYPWPSWNFVFGQASLSERVGVYSFARYDPAFYGEARPAGYRQLLLRRSLKVMAHEIGHMFGIAHCSYLACAMNGTNNLEETDRAPMSLCPICLRKLMLSAGFDPARRYEALARFFEGAGLAPEAAKMRGELARVAEPERRSGAP
jgi:archaemetzincin